MLMACTFFVKILNGQDSNSTLEVKDQIEVLVDSRDIMGANRLINQKLSLPPDFLLKKLEINLQIANDSEDQTLLAYTHLTYGNFWYSRGNRIKAFEHYTRSKEISEEIGDRLQLGLSLMNLANVEQDPSLRAILLRSATQHLIRENDKVNVAKCYMNMGNVFLMKVQTPSTKDMSDAGVSIPYVNNFRIKQLKDSAFYYYNLAQTIIDSIGSFELLSSISTHYAEWFLVEKNYELAEKYYKQALNYFNLAGNMKGSVYCMIQLIDIHIYKQNFDTALVLLNEATGISSKLNFLDNLTDLYLKYVQVYDSIGNYKLALQYSGRYNESQLALDHAISEDKIALLNMQYALNRQEIEIENLENKRRVNNLIIILITILSVSILSIAFFIRRNSRRKVVAADQLLAKNRKIYEIEQSLLQSKIENQILQQELLEKKVKGRSEKIIDFGNEMGKIESSLHQLYERVKSIKSIQSQEESSEVLNELQLSISQHLLEKRKLKELSSLSNAVNQDFFFYIDQNFPALTKDEKQLLSFLILDMSSKEIAQYLGITTESVHKKRYRLRKKLNLDHNDTFMDFYNKMIASFEVDKE
jgi:tetratricopeptide (TPR) repeat protein